MKIGAMNHPKRDILQEIRWMADLGLDFVDLTLEPPAAASWNADPDKIRKLLDETGLDVIGHTAYYLPMASPMEEVRKGAVTEFKRCLEVFSRVGAKWMNIHPASYAPMHDRGYIEEQNVKTLLELQDCCASLGVGLMVENLPEGFNTVEQLAPLMDRVPGLGLHLDIGHSNLRTHVNTAPELIMKWPDRLAHVHLHDNKGGGADLHLPLGVGTMDWRSHIRLLKKSGYDATITLEVFTEDHHYLTYSRDLLRDEWDS
jgi:sugar phosphate isomerase/epimerase